MDEIPVEAGSIKKNKRGSDHDIDSVTLPEPGFAPSFRTARVVRKEMSKEAVTAPNSRNASNLTFLRIRACDIRSDYERLCCCREDCDKVPFLHDWKEGDGDDDSKIQ